MFLSNFPIIKSLLVRILVAIDPQKGDIPLSATVISGMLIAII
ncbi:hypothetical protein N692_10580 [Lactiplantibacillus plantarum EGD-AQ4]|nr:hypothetical protein N692_10580 [Lactiplantibacillus plantarum EGD-AQ4]